MMSLFMYSANGGDIPKTLDNIAYSLSNAIRSGPQTLNHNGTVFRTEVYMRVDWEWLIYPIALLSLVSVGLAITYLISWQLTQTQTLIFFLTSFTLSTERSRAVWKSSNIAMLFHGLQGWPKEALSHERVEEMEKDAKSMRVKLTRDESGHLALVRE